MNWDEIEEAPTTDLLTRGGPLSARSVQLGKAVNEARYYAETEAPDTADDVQDIAILAEPIVIMAKEVGIVTLQIPAEHRNRFNRPETEYRKWTLIVLGDMERAAYDLEAAIYTKTLHDMTDALETLRDNLALVLVEVKRETLKHELIDAGVDVSDRT